MVRKKKITNVFLMSNEGLHPILHKIKKQYDDVREERNVRIITRGNVPLKKDFAKNVAEKVKDIVFDNPDAKYFIIFSGMPVYNLVIYNVVKDITKREPVVLLWNRDKDSYEEWNLSTRNLVF